jgi:hypothetical protein
MMQTYGHAIVPSPFPIHLTSKISAKELPGVAAHVTVKVKDTKLESTGPLITTGE